MDIHIVEELGSLGRGAVKIDSIRDLKNFFAMVHIPSIWFVQDKSDESNRPKYLNVGTVSSVWPLMVIAGGLFILVRLHEISMNLHLEGLRNMVAINPVLYRIGI